MSFKGTDIAAGNSRFENRIKFRGFCHFAPPFILPDLTHYFAIGALLSLLLTLNIFTPCSSVSIVNFEQVNTGWEYLGKSI